MLKSAWEIALERNEAHEDLSKITREYLEHVALLEECWNAIRPAERATETAPQPRTPAAAAQLRRAA